MTTRPTGSSHEVQEMNPDSCPAPALTAWPDSRVLWQQKSLDNLVHVTACLTIERS